jgi:hypothetical protein
MRFFSRGTFSDLGLIISVLAVIFGFIAFVVGVYLAFFYGLFRIFRLVFMGH